MVFIVGPSYIVNTCFNPKFGDLNSRLVFPLGGHESGTLLYIVLFLPDLVFLIKLVLGIPLCQMFISMLSCMSTSAQW